MERGGTLEVILVFILGMMMLFGFMRKAAAEKAFF